MEIVAWALVVLLAGAAAVFGRRAAREGRARRAIEALTEDLRTGASPEAPATGDHEAVARLRETIRDRWVPSGTELERGRAEGRDQALRGMARYLEANVTGPLSEALDSGDDLEEPARGAVNALEDLAFFGRDLESEELVPGSLGEVVAEVTREFARDYEVPVKFLGPDRPVHVAVASETLKDALYLILVNAVRFGAEATVEVRLEEAGGGCSLEVVDRGQGFREEALQRATEPFFTTSPDSLGLGLTWVERVVSHHGGSVRLRNRREGGAAVELRLPTSSTR